MSYNLPSGETSSTVVAQNVSPEAQTKVIAALQQIHGQNVKAIDAITSPGSTYTANTNTKLVLDGVGGTLNLTTHGAHVVALGDLATSVQLYGSGNQVFAGAGNDYLASNGGTNKLVAGSGMDTLQGGSGHDTLVGGGQSLLMGGTGNNYLSGGLTSSSHDTLIGGTGNDKIVLSAGNNVASAGTGQSTVYGGSGHDTLIGGGRSALHAGSGGSTLLGGTVAGAHDTLYGGTGRDSLSVTQGNNQLHAGTGADTLQGGSGHDTLYGGGHSLLMAGAQRQRHVRRCDQRRLRHDGRRYRKRQILHQGNVWFPRHDHRGGGQDTLYLTNVTHNQATFTQATDGSGSTVITFGHNNSVTVTGVQTVQFAHGISINPADPAVLHK